VGERERERNFVMREKENYNCREINTDRKAKRERDRETEIEEFQNGHLTLNFFLIQF
jgi:hypothetical protein